METKRVLRSTSEFISSHRPAGVLFSSFPPQASLLRGRYSWACPWVDALSFFPPGFLGAPSWGWGGVGVGWEYSGIPGGGQRAKGCLSPRGSGFLRGFTDQWQSPSYSFSICTHLRLAVCITYPWSVGAKLFIEWVRRPPGTGWAAGPIGLEPQATLGPWS